MKKLILKIVLILLLFPCMVLAEETEIGENISENEQEEVKEEVDKKTSVIVTLEKCIDGDTAKLKSENGSVITYRFLAINAPELSNLENEEEPFAMEASKYTCDKLTTADQIKLEFDENANEKDAYDRGLAWVFVDGELLQEELISKGYAKVGYLYDEYKYSARLQEKEEEAKRLKVGIWDLEKTDKQESEAEKEETDKNQSNDSNPIFKFLNDIVENLLASFNNFVDSILQMIEDML